MEFIMAKWKNNVRNFGIASMKGKKKSNLSFAEVFTSLIQYYVEAPLAVFSF